MLRTYTISIPNTIHKVFNISLITRCVNLYTMYLSFVLDDSLTLPSLEKKIRIKTDRGLSRDLLKRKTNQQAGLQDCSIGLVSTPSRQSFFFNIRFNILTQDFLFFGSTKCTDFT